MRVLLVESPYFFVEQPTSRQTMPVGLGYVAAAVRAEHDVRMLLPDVRPPRTDSPWEELVGTITDEQPQVVGISAVTQTYPAAIELARRLKTAMPPVTTVLGGVHATCSGIEAAQPCFDFVVAGEGEVTFRELLRNIEEQGTPTGEQLGAIAGLIFRDESGQLRENTARPPIADLDTVPFPHREDLLWAEDVTSSFYGGLITMRGCPFRCTFCSIPKLGKLRMRSPQNVVDELQFLKSRYDIQSVFFNDSIFNLNKRRTLQLCRRMADQRLEVFFTCQLRADRVDGETLEAARGAGLGHVCLGIESGNAETLTRIGKPMRLDTISTAVRRIKDLGILCTGYFMVGFPWEDEEAIRRSVGFALNIGLDQVFLMSVVPLPGSELWETTRDRAEGIALDYRKPQVNLTGLADDHYVQLFSELQSLVQQYNLRSVV